MDEKGRTPFSKPRSSGIGARRLQTVMERVLDEISYTAPDRDGDDMVIDAPYVHANVGDLAKNTDLSRYIL